MMTDPSPATQAQEQQGPTDEEIMEILPAQLHCDLSTLTRRVADCAGIGGNAGIVRVVLNAGLLEFARAVLARWGGAAPQPVPVSERLPQPEDCDEDGGCWFYSGDWMMKRCRYRGAYDTHWLPASALPQPEVEG